MEISSFHLAYRPNVIGENGHRKRIFSKTLATRLRVDGLKLGFSNGRHALFAEHNACFVSDAIVCPLFSVFV